MRIARLDRGGISRYAPGETCSVGVLCSRLRTTSAMAYGVRSLRQRDGAHTVELRLHNLGQLEVAEVELPTEAAAHAPMLEALRHVGPAEDALTQVRTAAADMFVRGLEHCGVFGGDVVAGCQALLARV